MKKHTILTLTIILLTHCSTPQKTLLIKTFTKEVIVKDLPETSEKLFIKANSWMIDVFVSKNNVIEFTDKKQQVLIGKYELYETFIKGKNYKYYAKIDVRIKHNSIKLKIYPITNIYTSKKSANIEIRNKIKHIADDFEKKMKIIDTW